MMSQFSIRIYSFMYRLNVYNGAINFFQRFKCHYPEKGKFVVKFFYYHTHNLILIVC